MSLAETLLALALLAQVAWTFAVMLRAGQVRFRAVREGRAPTTGLLNPYGWPDDAQKIANNMNNQFETPTLFYALVLLALVLERASLPLGILAWVYVASRIGHTVVHAGSNDLRLRFPVFMVGIVALMVMTALLAASILLGPIA